MDVELYCKTAPARAIDDNKRRDMSDTINITRRKNARYILNKHCDGVTKTFATLLGKAEQQCSNFLRDNATVKIGPRIAREIEFTFGYPNGWLDVEHKEDDSSKNINPKLIDHLIKSNNSLKSISSALFEGVSAEDSLLLSRRLADLSEKVELLSRQSRQAMFRELEKKTIDALLNCSMEAKPVDSGFSNHGSFLCSEDWIYEIRLPENLPRWQNTEYELLSVMNCLADDYSREYNRRALEPIRTNAHETAIFRKIQATNYYWVVPIMDGDDIVLTFLNKLIYVLMSNCDSDLSDLPDCKARDILLNNMDAILKEYALINEIRREPFAEFKDYSDTIESYRNRNPTFGHQSSLF